MRRWVFGVLVVIALLATACSGDDDAPSPDDEAQVVRPTPRPAPTPEGELLESFDRASAGAIVAIGLEPEDSLPIYALPGDQNPIIGEIPGNASDVSALGEAVRTEDGQTWQLLQHDGKQGWVQRGVVYVGLVEDITAEVAAEASSVVSSSIDELALQAAEQFVPEGSRAVLVEPAEFASGFTGTAIVDIAGLQDDSVAGYRLHVTASGNASQGSEFEFVSVTRTLLCFRGVSAEGVCV